MEHSVFSEISIIVAIGAGVAAIMHLLRQPLIIGHILTGIIVGPGVLNIVHSEDTVGALANIGIVLLLYIIGLGLNPRVIREVGKVSLIAGFIQVILMAVVGYTAAYAFGFSQTEALIAGIGLSFSSTIIILKLLSDKKEQTRLYGKIAIGLLLVQDVIATVALFVLSANTAQGFSLSEGGIVIVKGMCLGVILGYISLHIMPKMRNIIASSQEFLFLFAIGWGLGIATLFELSGFSIEVGALFAGVTLAGLPYAQEISAKLRPLRDFFIVLFFISLGAQIDFSSFSDVLVPVAIFSLLVIVVKPLIIMIVTGYLGYTKRTSFLASISMGQISEFSLILAILAERSGLISSEMVAILTLTALITIAASTYLISYSGGIYESLKSNLKMFERRKVRYEQSPHSKFSVVLFGYKKGGNEFAKVFKNMHHRFVVVDYDPDVIDQLEHQRLNYLYGDATDIELLDEIGIDEAHVVASIMTDFETTKFLVTHVRGVNQKAIIICRSESVKEATDLYAHGASYVMLPHYLGAERIMLFIKKNGFRKSHFDKFREKHLEYLEQHQQELEPTSQ